MNTYTVNVNIGTTIQVTISADNEDDAELNDNNDFIGY